MRDGRIDQVHELLKCMDFVVENFAWDVNKLHSESSNAVLGHKLTFLYLKESEVWNILLSQVFEKRTVSKGFLYRSFLIVFGNKATAFFFKHKNSLLKHVLVHVNQVI